ncbi:MAG: hypothetical protein ACRYGR_06750 [Janthinobacterium lividum]
MKLSNLEPQLLEELASIKKLQIFVLTDEDNIKRLNVQTSKKKLEHIINDFRVMGFKKPFSTIDFKL